MCQTDAIDTSPKPIDAGSYSLYSSYSLQDIVFYLCPQSLRFSLTGTENKEKCLQLEVIGTGASLEDLCVNDNNVRGICLTFGEISFTLCLKLRSEGIYS